jgi:hypothetical protein
MRTTAVNTTALALLLSCVALALGQTAPTRGKSGGKVEKAPPAKSKLEEMLARALKDNPDIRVAAAKLGEAEAELNRVRLQVMQKVVTLYHTTELARTDVATAERALARMRALGKAVSREELDAAEAALAAAKAKLAAVEAEVPYVTGKQPQMAAADTATLRGLLHLSRLQAAGALEGSFHDLATGGKAGVQLAPRPVQGPIADRLRKALDAPVSLRVTEGGVGDVLDLLRKKEPALNIKFVPSPSAPQKLSLELKDLPLGAALEYLEDSLPGYRILVREYGLLITPTDRVPPGAVSLHDFWKRGRGEAAGKNPPAKDVEGVIKRVDTGSGLVTISIGSDAGLVKGNTLEVFVTAPTPKYRGTIQVLDTNHTEAVCRPVVRMLGTLQVGDRVASRLKEK